MKKHLQSYWRLMRFDKPIGIALLWFPVAWALWLANQGQPSWHLVGLFLLGTVVMRAAGCIINDIADRHIDIHVKRTSSRPLTSGEIGIFSAIGLFVTLLWIAFFIVIQLPIACFYWSWVALGVTVVYPFCKRWLQAPQLILSIAFSVAIPMVYVASGASLTLITLLLVSINMLWVLSYDTMYAMVDRADDLHAGVKSTAVLLGHWECPTILSLQSILHGLWLILGLSLQSSQLFYGGWFLGALIIAYQQYLISSRDPQACFKAFKISAWYGFIMWITVATTLHGGT